MPGRIFAFGQDFLILNVLACYVRKGGDVMTEIMNIVSLVSLFGFFTV